MMKYVWVALVAGSGLVSQTAGAATSKETDCTHQAAVVDAVRAARLAGVNERNVPAFVKIKATWPESYGTAVPLVTPWVYEMKMADVKAQDLAAAWKEMCLAQ